MRKALIFSRPSLCCDVSLFNLQALCLKMAFVSEVVLVELLKPFAVKFEFHLFFRTRQERLEYIYAILEAFLEVQWCLSVFIM